MPSDSVNEMTRSEWRELGFFYERDDEARAWRLVGSGGGLGGFCSLLEQYASDPRMARTSEHEHYGPYAYLKLVTWPDAGVVKDGLYARRGHPSFRGQPRAGLTR
jgi:hypothetical protein